MLLDVNALWYAATNAWVVAAGPGEPALVVDAPPDPVGMGRLLERHDLVPSALLLTHGHVDHMGGAEAIRSKGAVTWVHPDDDFLTKSPTQQLEALFGMVPPGEYPAPAETEPLSAGQRLDVAGISVEVLHTPGHTPGHCCFFVEDEGWLFSGDQLFAGSIGRTDLPGGDTAELFRSMREHIMVLDDDVRVLPGHGPETTVGRERKTNPFRFEWR